MRLYELAKELGLESRKLLSFFKSKNIELKSNLVKLSDDHIALARKTFFRRVKLMESEEILKKAREEEKKARQKKKKEEEKKRKEEEQKRKEEAKKLKKEQEERQAKKKEKAAKKKAKKTKGKTDKKGKTIADKVAERLKKSQATAAKKKTKEKTARKKPKKSKKAAEEIVVDETPVLSLGDDAEQYDPDDIRQKIIVLEEEARKREEREEKQASIMRRRHGWSMGGTTQRARPRRRPAKHRYSKKSTVIKHVRPEKVTLAPPVSVRDFSFAVGVKVRDLLAYLMKKGQRSTINTIISEETIIELGIEYDIEIEIKEPKGADEYFDELENFASDDDSMQTRPPVITLLGHVDHGKTSLLDRIRATNVHEHEAGGITQHISTYKIAVEGRELVFVDTPGHEAFTEMRARGANVTDIVVLVVAADDGVMPQTEEAINHAKAAEVPIVVALNKIDKPNANRLRAKQQLATLGLTSEEWGGDIGVVELSAVTGEGINDLLERLLIEADMLELEADPSRPAMGTVLEAKLTQGIGIVAAVIIKDGTLSIGDDILAGKITGRVRALYDMEGNQIEKALPSWPVQMTGLSEVPGAGDKLYVVDNVQKAKDVVADIKERQRQDAVASRESVTLENLFSKFQEGKIKDFRLVLKTDVKGTSDVILATLEGLSTDEVKVKILHAGVGNVNESDVILAEASQAVVIGFSVEIDDAARSLADEKSVDIRIYNIIYELTSHVKAAMEGLLEPEERELIKGHCEVRQTFRSSKVGTVAGCQVLDGLLTRNNRARIKRGGEVIHEGNINSLRRFKDDVREVKEGFECGVGVSGFSDIQLGDIIEAYEIEKVARKLE